MQTNQSIRTRSRGGNRREPVHVSLLILAILLLTLAAVLLIFHLAIPGIISMVVAIAIAMWDSQR